MLFRKLVRLLANSGEKLLWLAVIAFAVTAVLLATSSSLPTVSARIFFGISRSAGCLMTLDSPESIEGPGYLVVFARAAAWLVSLSGWLLIPTLVGTLLASEQ